MSARGTFQTLIVVLLALLCVGFVAVVGMSAAATPVTAEDGGNHEYDSTDYDRSDDRYNDSRSFDDPSDDRSDYEERSREGDASRIHVNVHATEEVLTVTNRGENPVVATIEALEGSYAGEGQYRLQPGDTLDLPAPDEPSKIRVLAESDDDRVEAIIRYRAYEFDCAGFSHSQVAPGSLHVEWEAGSHADGRTHQFDRPEFECPSDGAPGGEGPPEDPQQAYNESHDRFWEGYENGTRHPWRAYSLARAVLWDTYEDGHGTFWGVYEQVIDDGDDDGNGDGPQDRFNETRDALDGEVNDTQEFAERVGGDVRDGAERVGEDAQAGADRVENDTRNDVDRVRDDAESGRERLENDANETIDDLGPDGDDNESDDGQLPEDPLPEDVPPEGVPPEDVPPEGVPPGDLLPEDVPPEDLLPEDVPPEDVPPEDVPPGDDNGSDDDPLPEGEAVSADASADAGREGDTVYAEGSVTVDVADGTAHARLYEYLEAEGAIAA